MQGKYDPRGSKAGIRPEHNVANYLDKIVDDAIDYFKPYAQNIMYVSPGNHESSLLKRQETDIIYRFTQGVGCLTGAYSGWVLFNVVRGTSTRIVNMSYHHGYGGGGPVTKDVIQASRKAVYLPDADIVVSGHCFDEETEILTENGWIRYEDITKDTRVATMNLETRAMEYQKVNSIHIYDDYKELIHVQHKGVDIMTTDEHGMVYLNTAKKIAKCTMAKFVNKSHVSVFNSCKYFNQYTVDIDDKYLKLAAWVVSDGTYDGNHIRFHFRKQRKIDRVSQLLKEAGLEHNVGIRGANNSVKIGLTVEASNLLKNKMQLDGKNFSNKYYFLNSRQCELVLNEYRYADGHSVETHDSYVLYGTNDENLSVLQSMCIKVGRKSTLYYELDKRGVNRLNVSTKSTTIMSKVKHKVVPYSGKVWCVNVDNGTLVVRRNGCVVITQNTHDRWVFPIVRAHLNNITGKQTMAEQLHLKLGTYKDEYTEGNGWAIEKGHPPKSLGGVWLHIDHERETSGGKDIEKIKVKAELA
jgi:hypothetical protein